MKKRNKKHEKRMRKLIVGCGLCAIVLTVSTYAWFIGMKTVNVSSFDVSIAAIDGLSLSLDGETWSSTVEINQANHKLEDTSYTTNTNSWGGKGLIPVSTVGKINTDVSRLTLYEKGSFTATTGGYRVMASEVLNKEDKEADGYVAFDLFIRNLSGNKYYEENNVKNEEAIYLATDSEVIVADGGAENTGIENSVRVAFAQIGRVKAGPESTAAIVQSINCQGAIDAKTGKNVGTGICRDAQIWEPNDTKHVQNALNWYETSCKARSGADVTLEGSYSGDCKKIIDGVPYATYAINRVIDYGDNVDVYDGEDYNGYTQSVTDGKLYEFPYFTDTMKNYEGPERPQFISLAPNSITKVRVYVYIEGQDVDNYDFASLGKKISVAFGFTKERFFDEDVDYDPTYASLPDDLIKDNHYTPIITGGDN